MYLSLCRVTAGSGMEWNAFVDLASRAGYEAVDVDFEPARKAGASATLDLLASRSLKPGCCPVPVEFRKDQAAFDAGMAELDVYAKLAVDLGCPRMATWVPPAFDTPADQMRKTLQNRFTAIAKVLAGHGVRVGLEFITPLHLRESGHPCVWTMADMLALAHECGDNVGLLLDCWHWHHDPDHSVQAIIDAGRERIVTVHLNDSPDLPPEKIRDNRRLLPGEGVIDLAGFLGALRQIGYNDAVTLEIFGRLDDLPPEDAARRAADAARKVMAG